MAKKNCMCEKGQIWSAFYVKSPVSTFNSNGHPDQKTDCVDFGNWAWFFRACDPKGQTLALKRFETTSNRNENHVDRPELPIEKTEDELLI